MWTRRIVPTLLVVGGLTALSSWESRALAATPAASDLTDFIQKLGGYMFPNNDGTVQIQIFWEQISYVVTPAASSSNITKIVMTKYPKASVYSATGTGLAAPANPTPPTTAPALPSAFNVCAADNYTIETITLDLRDLQATATKSQDVDASNTIWKVTLKTPGGKFIRQNTQTLPANCPSPNTNIPKSAMQQQDVSQYAIVFADEGQARQFAWLVSNVIPTLNAPILVGTPPS